MGAGEEEKGITHLISHHSPSFKEGVTTAWTQEVGQRMEQLPRGWWPIIYGAICGSIDFISPPLNPFMPCPRVLLEGGED
jgi:hypothetical protein